MKGDAEGQAQQFRPVISAIWEVEIKRITVEKQPRQKLAGPHLSQPARHSDTQL
jgi:hypothetical protein